MNLQLVHVSPQDLPEVVNNTAEKLGTTFSRLKATPHKLALGHQE
jgi:hypothetical protein